MKLNTLPRILAAGCWHLAMALWLVLAAVAPVSAGDSKLGVPARVLLQAAAGCDGKLKYGDHMTSTLATRGAECNYTFQGKANDLVSVLVLSPRLQTRTTVVGPDGGQITVAGNSVRGLRLPADGVYAVHIVARNGQQTGPFTISLVWHGVVRQTPVAPVRATPTGGGNRPLAPAATPAPALPDTEPVPMTGTECGGALSGEGVYAGAIAPGGSCTYTLDLNVTGLAQFAWISVVMTATSGNLAPLVVVYDIEGAEIARSDAGQVRALASNPGTYTIVAMSSNGAGGDFALELDLVYAAPLAFICGSKLRYGHTVTNTIDEAGKTCQYTFYVGRSNRVISIRMTPTSGDLQPRLTISNPDGVVVKEQFGNIVSYRLSGTGVYSLVAGAVNDDSTGEFNLTLTCNANCPP